MFSKENRTLRDDTQLGCVFGFFGGYTNAAAALVLLHEIAPMSANWGGMANALEKLDYQEVFTFIPLLFCFISGAFLGTKWCKKNNPETLVIVESVLLITVSLIAPVNLVLAISIGALAMGMQNGMSTTISHHAVRTTHVTSSVTDIGIFLATKNYRKAFALLSKIFAYISGAIAGVSIVHYYNERGYMAFAVGGVFLLLIMLIHGFYPKMQSALQN